MGNIFQPPEPHQVVDLLFQYIKTMLIVVYCLFQGVDLSQQDGIGLCKDGWGTDNRKKDGQGKFDWWVHCVFFIFLTTDFHSRPGGKDPQDNAEQGVAQQQRPLAEFQ